MMNSKKSLAMFLLSFLMLLETQNLFADSSDLTIVGRFDPNIKGGVALRFIVKNVSAQPVEVPENYLPWGDGLSLDFYVIEEGKKPRLRETLPFIGQVPPTKVTIKPGEELSGLVDLATRFPDAEQLVKRQSLIVWIWNGSRLARFEGVNVSDQVGGVRTNP
jgi:hypothetical protein